MNSPTPSIDQCFLYIEQFEMLDNIRQHSLKVAAVAELLWDGLSRSSSPDTLPEKQLVIAGALLHDIAKTRCLAGNCLHAEEGQVICNELGLPEIGEIVAEHVVLRKFHSENYKKGIFGAKELVYYADKRVRHDQIVSLQERLLYILERYGNGNPEKEQRIRENFQTTVQFESYLFTFVDFSADSLEDQLEQRYQNFSLYDRITEYTNK